MCCWRYLLASRQRQNQILDELRTTHATIRTLPGIDDLAHRRVTVNDLRELDIEDLLGRDAVPPNQLLLSKNIRDKTVLVTYLIVPPFLRTPAG